MVLTELVLLAALNVFQRRGVTAPALETLVWVWPLCWFTVLAGCMAIASWGRLASRPTTGLVGRRQIAQVMVFRLLISAGLTAVPLIATCYAIVMLILALASDAPTPQ